MEYDPVWRVIARYKDCVCCRPLSDSVGEGRQRPTEPVSCHLPPLGWHKLNNDGARCCSSGVAGCGGTIRGDTQGLGTMASMKREAMRSLRAMPKAIHYGKTRRQPKKNPKTRILVVLDG
ncbi:hypothetical protein V6N11_017136 [Hibiscus sabdariffa]|uniref:Uncharacterized protein n=1 Tax=Hibiscus sabdariffa TaxID=183260 RepID=A0ABR2TX73_9ROSI